MSKPALAALLCVTEISNVITWIGITACYTHLSSPKELIQQRNHIRVHKIDYISSEHSR